MDVMHRPSRKILVAIFSALIGAAIWIVNNCAPDARCTQDSPAALAGESAVCFAPCDPTHTADELTMDYIAELRREISRLEQFAGEQSAEILRLSERIATAGSPYMNGVMLEPELPDLADAFSDCDALFLGSWSDVSLFPHELLNRLAEETRLREAAGVDFILSELGVGDSRTRIVAALVAGKLDIPETVGPLERAALQDDEPSARRAAVEALASMSSWAAGDALDTIVRSSAADSAVRLTAWSGLARLGREQAIETLADVAAQAQGEITPDMVIAKALEHVDIRLHAAIREACERSAVTAETRSHALAIIAERESGT